MQTTPDIEKLPDSIDPDLDLDKVRKQCRALVKKRAKYSAGVAVVPVPFLDVAVDAGLLTQLLPEISKRFGLISERESAIDLESKEVHWAEMKDRAVDFAGLMATRGLVKKTIQGFGGRIVAKQVTKFVPLGGQIVAASLGYMIFKKIAFDHIDQCYKLAKDIQQKQHSKTVNSGAHTATNKNNNSTEKKSVDDAAAEDKSVVDKVVDKASVVIDKASEKVSDVMDKASEKAEEVSNKAADTAQDVAEKADVAADKVAEKAEQVAEQTATTAKKAAEEADKAAAKAEEAADKAADNTQKVAEKAEEIADEAAESIKKASATKGNKK